MLIYSALASEFFNKSYFEKKIYGICHNQYVDLKSTLRIDINMRDLASGSSPAPIKIFGWGKIICIYVTTIYCITCVWNTAHYYFSPAL